MPWLFFDDCNTVPRWREVAKNWPVPPDETDGFPPVYCAYSFPLAGGWVVEDDAEEEEEEAAVVEELSGAPCAIALSTSDGGHWMWS